MRLTCGFLVLLMVGGCAKLPFFEPRAPSAAPGVSEAVQPDGAEGGIQTDVPGAAAPPPPSSARTVDQFDTTSEADRQEAAAAPAAPAETRLGTTIASLGDPSQPGFWAETPLVSTVQEGRLEYPTTGKTVKVELRPSSGEPGSGTRVSLPALRLLDAPLTALPQLVVYKL